MPPLVDLYTTSFLMIHNSLLSNGDVSTSLNVPPPGRLEVNSVHDGVAPSALSERKNLLSDRIAKSLLPSTLLCLNCLMLDELDPANEALIAVKVGGDAVALVVLHTFL